MIIQLSEIMNIKDCVRKMTIPIELDKFSLRGVSYSFVSKKPVEFVIINLNNRKVRIKADSEVVLSVPCDRCLEEVEVSIPINAEAEIDFNETDEKRTENLDETSYITGYNLDTDRLVNEEILMGFPMKVVCMEECKGICSVCGANLNKGECGCDRSVHDPRMSVIRDIFNNFKEV